MTDADHNRHAPRHRLHDRFDNLLALLDGQLCRLAQHAKDRQAVSAALKLEINQMAQAVPIDL